MSIPLTSLAKIAVGILAGTAIIAPATYSLSKGEVKQQEKTEQLRSNKDTCWTFIEGTDERGEESRKLLVCANLDSSHESFSYYLYTKDKGGIEKLSPEIKTVSFERGIPMKLVFGFMEPNGKAEALWISHGLWDFLKQDYELKSKCKVSLVDATRKLECKQSSGPDRYFWLTTSVTLPKPIKELLTNA